MQNHLMRALNVLVLMSAGITFAAGADGPPPTREQRDEVKRRLEKDEGAYGTKKSEVEKADLMITNLGKSIEALETTLAPLLKDVADKDKDDPLRVEVTKMQTTLTKLKEIRTNAVTNIADTRKNANLLQLELNKTLKDYFSKADPKMIADRFGIDFDDPGLFGGTSQFKERTSAPPGVRVHYGLGAEFTWDDSVGGDPFWGGGTVMKAISQHEQVTTRDMYDTAERLLQKKLPGFRPLIGRVAMTPNIDDLRAHPDAYKHIFGNESFPPSVLNNSTRWYNDIDKDNVFRELMDLYTRGGKTKTFKVDGAEVTYGLPTIGQPILSNSAGNGGWNDRPNFTIQKNFYPYRLNIGSTAQGAQKDANRRDDKAPVALEDYCSANYTDACIQRPRWNTDGSPVRTQYVNPQYRRIISDNLWRLAGKGNGKDYKGTPTEAELADEKMYPPELVKAVKHDIEWMANSVPGMEGTDAAGFNSNLRGTSFSSPRAAGVLYAARTLFPDASEPEIIGAFLAACQPLYHRLTDDTKPPVDDLLYVIDAKTGYRFSPRGAGYGEFVIRDDATEKNPDSWVRMQQMLTLMQQERMKMTRNGKAVTTVDVGEGPNVRKAVLNGQPAPVTVELPSLKEANTEAMNKEAKRLHEAVIEAFTKSDMHACTSVLGSDIMELVDKKDYKAAVDKYKDQYVSSGFVGENDPFYEDIKKAAKEAEDGRAFTYSVNVPAGHDLCCTFASMRLKFKEVAQADRYIVLESPDGRMLPVTLSDPHNNLEVGSTSGFMNASALGKNKSGTWKIHTRGELDTGNSMLVLSGTERNPDLGVVDVRETVLAKVIEREAKARTSIPAKNTLTITDPHALLRDWNGLAPAKAEKIKLTPSTYEDQRDYLQEWLNNSQMRKGGFLPKDVKLIRPGLTHTEPPTKTSMLDSSPMDRVLVAAATKLYDLLVSSNAVSTAPETPQKRLGTQWGDLATALAKTDVSMPARRGYSSSGKGYLAELNDPDMPLWRRQSRIEQVRAARHKQPNTGIV